MRFSEVKQADVDAQRRSEDVRAETERRWFLGDLVVQINVWPEDDRITLIVYQCQFTQGCTLYVGTTVPNDTPILDVKTEYVHDAVRLLSSDQLHRVAACREVAEAWVRGERQDLPIAPPSSIPRKSVPSRRL